MNNFKFLGKMLIDAELECLTGLHIGGTQEGYEIGGMDNPVIKTPTGFRLNDVEIPPDCPYIPGSSLKGKLRSLLEWAEGKIELKYKDETFTGPVHICKEENCVVCVSFGVSASESTVSGPTRITVLDSFPNQQTINSWHDDMGEGIFTEVKSENYIDRLSSQATPRPMERVPAGSVFRTNIIYTFYKSSDLEMLKHVLLSMEILEDSTLGGSGSRGSGRVRFRNFGIKFRPKDYYTNGVSEVIVEMGVNGVGDSVRELRQKSDNIFQVVRTELERIEKE